MNLAARGYGLGAVQQPADQFLRSPAVAPGIMLNAAGGSRDRKLAEYASRALEERGFRTDFTSEEMNQVTGRAVRDDDPSIKNLQNLPWMSTDNRSTVNAEQLTVAERLPGGAIKVRVAVSDVDAAVPEGSPLDLHARQNGEAIYAPGKNFPMLPWKMLDDMTSFQENQERLAVVTEFVVEGDGSVSDFDCYRARVKNHGQLTFDKVGSWLNGTFPKSEDGHQMKLQSEASERLSQNRERNELVGLAGNDRPAREMIEELMETTNEVTVDFLEKKGYPVIFKTKGKPDRWDRIRDLAQRHGHGLPQEASSPALRKFLSAQKSKLDSDDYGELSLSVGKLLGVSYYAVKEPGEDYPEDYRLNGNEAARATSPSRDYCSLTVQRMLKSALRGEAPDSTGLRELVSHCNEASDEAYRAKRQVYKSKDALRLQSRIGQKFDAVVTGSSKKGVYVKLRDDKAEGKVIQNQGGLDVGDRVRVRLKSVDADRGYIDFEALR